MAIISLGHREKLRNQIIEGARNYNKYLVKKTFCIICEDGSETEVHFNAADYKHLTGIKSDLNDLDFYKDCIKGTIDVGNISSEQKYNWSTLKNKCNNIARIHTILYSDTSKTLLMECLETNTYLYPIAIKDFISNICVAFVSNNHRARSLRKASSSNDCKEEKRIIAIFARNQESCLYDQIIYIASLKEVFEKNKSIVARIADTLKIHFDSILGDNNSDESCDGEDRTLN
ncbi:MAG: PBECR4 domain-containing protein [Eubacteriales bacterium]|nr:PBECR4 domain-containing protein [Eubacteriales bacterium]